MDLIDHVVSCRRKTCPKTSYASSGRAATTLVVFTNLNCRTDFDTLWKLLLNSKEFDHIEYTSEVDDVIHMIAGGVLIVYLSYQQQLIHTAKTMLEEGKFKLVLFIHHNKSCENDLMNKYFIGAANSEFYALQFKEFGDFSIVSFSKQITTVSTSSKINDNDKRSIGFNKQPSVASMGQFRYLWSRICPLQQGYDFGKERVLQRLADRPLHCDAQTMESNKGAESKLSTAQWDAVIAQLLANPSTTDFHIYSAIRQKALGTTLEHALNEVGRSEDAANKKSSSPDDEGGTGGGDGRAMHMVDMTIQCIPPAIRNRIRCILDYGCAEGAITAELGKKLNVSASNVYGADVRSIPSEGFTFVQLETERDDGLIPSPGSILPSIKSGTVDLITAAMVFHHVTHVSAILLELRRVISANGALVIREHHCVSSDNGAFLDIIHGLYSLAWSSPVEWPDFLREYKAFYRSREEWNALLLANGFIQAPFTPESTRHYNYADKSRPNRDGWFPNVIKAYYAVYLPDPTFVFQGTTTLSTSLSAKESTGLKRNLDTTNTAALWSGAEVSLIGSSERNTANSMNNMNTANKKPRGDEVLAFSQMQTKPPQSTVLERFESKNYPGRFYTINPVTNERVWEP